jgi:hypothetical protein
VSYATCNPRELSHPKSVLSLPGNPGQATRGSYFRHAAGQTLKPDARTNTPIAQLAIYALALTRRVPGLKLFDIRIVFFFIPRTYPPTFPHHADVHTFGK